MLSRDDIKKSSNNREEVSESIFSIESSQDKDLLKCLPFLFLSPRPMNTIRLSPLKEMVLFSPNL